MYVDGLLPGAFGEMHRVSGLPTLFFTAVSVVAGPQAGPDPGVETSRRPHLPGGRDPARNWAARSSTRCWVTWG